MRAQIDFSLDTELRAFAAGSFADAARRTGEMSHYIDHLAVSPTAIPINIGRSTHKQEQEKVRTVRSLGEPMECHLSPIGHQPFWRLTVRILSTT